MKSKISVFIAILTITALGKSFGAFPVKQVSLIQNSLTGNDRAMISSTEKYKMAAPVFSFSDFQKAGNKQYAMNTFISYNSFIYEKTDISQNVMTGFSRKNLQKNMNDLLTIGLVLLGIGLAGMLGGGLMIAAAAGAGIAGGMVLSLLGGFLFFIGLIVTICGLATKNSRRY